MQRVMSSWIPLVEAVAMSVLSCCVLTQRRRAFCRAAIIVARDKVSQRKVLGGAMARRYYPGPPSRKHERTKARKGRKKHGEAGWSVRNDLQRVMGLRWKEGL